MALIHVIIYIYASLETMYKMNNSWPLTKTTCPDVLPQNVSCLSLHFILLFIPLDFVLLFRITVFRRWKKTWMSFPHPQILHLELTLIFQLRTQWRIFSCVCFLWFVGIWLLVIPNFVISNFPHDKKKNQKQKNTIKYHSHWDIYLPSSISLSGRVV